ncbi:unnamed protein product [Gulo gulo]|uniref:Uncharacterized protein n=1 Tax=Gulo gulo TaxID=48420 RepID=A0A9X9LEJ5_GULGU|nr:unnamed protein product [Gulo gulo]
MEKDLSFHLRARVQTMFINLFSSEDNTFHVWRNKRLLVMSSLGRLISKCLMKAQILLPGTFNYTSSFNYSPALICRIAIVFS